MRHLKLLFIIYMYCMCNNPKTTNDDKFLFENDSVESILVPIGDSASFTFNFRNIGKKELKIINIGTSCNCTVVKFDTASILPGSKGSLQIKYINSGDTGIIHKSIVVETNSSTEPLHSLYLVLKDRL